MEIGKFIKGLNCEVCNKLGITCHENGILNSGMPGVRAIKLDGKTVEISLSDIDNCPVFIGQKDMQENAGEIIIEESRQENNFFSKLNEKLGNHTVKKD